MTVRLSAALVPACLLLGAAHAQVGGTLAPLLAHPLLEGRKPGASGLLTLGDGSAVLLRQRGGRLTGVNITVSNGMPPGLSVVGPGVAEGNGKATAAADGGGAGPGVARAATLAGLFSGYGEGLSRPLQVFLNRADVVPRLKDGVTVQADPFTLQIRVTGAALSLKLDLAQVPESEFAATSNVLAARKPGVKPVVLRLYSDFQCPYCQKLEAEALPSLMQNLPDDVHLEFHHFPLEAIHPLARPAAEASECAAGQGRFWAYKDALFGDDAWKSGNPNTTFIALAQKTGLDLPAFKTCLAERGGKAAVDAALQEAGRLGLNATPTVFVNGYRVANAFDVAAILSLIAYARDTR